MIRRWLMLAAVVLAAAPGAVQAQQPTQAEPPAAKMPPVKLAAMRDSFFIMVNARAVGTSIFSVTPSSSGFVVKETDSMPSMGVQVTEVTTDANGHPLLVNQSGLMAGQNVALSIKYDQGRAKGTSKLPDGSTRTIDAAVPVNVIDDNTLQAFLPVLPWTATSKWDFPVFSGGGAELTTQTLVVTDVVPVSIPAGKFDAYRAELRTGKAVVAFYISKSVPHRILKIAPGGAPFEYVRAE